MGERKVLNKYIPADFDPSLVPRSKKAKDGMVSVRMMLPFSIQCSTCNTFMYRGRKFNSKKEPVEGASGRYLGIQRFRFYIKCTACSRPVTFLTDPKNADYEMESGATRNYEVYKDKEKTKESDLLQKEEEEKEDPMRALENRVLESQREMQELDNLEEIKAMNMRHLQQQIKTGGDGFGDEAKAVMMAREMKQAAEEAAMLNEHGLTESEEALVKSIKFGQKPPEESIRRLNEQDEKNFEERRKQKLEEMANKKTKAMPERKSAMPIIKVKRKRVDSRQDTSKTSKAEETKSETVASGKPNGGDLGGLLGGYGSSDSDSD